MFICMNTRVFLRACIICYRRRFHRRNSSIFSVYAILPSGYILVFLSVYPFRCLLFPGFKNSFRKPSLDTQRNGYIPNNLKSLHCQYNLHFFLMIFQIVSTGLLKSLRLLKSHNIFHVIFPVLGRLSKQENGLWLGAHVFKKGIECSYKKS